VNQPTEPSGTTGQPDDLGRRSPVVRIRAETPPGP